MANACAWEIAAGTVPCEHRTQTHRPGVRLRARWSECLREGGGGWVEGVVLGRQKAVSARRSRSAVSPSSLSPCAVHQHRPWDIKHTVGTQRRNAALTLCPTSRHVRPSARTRVHTHTKGPFENLDILENVRFYIKGVPFCNVFDK